MFAKVTCTLLLTAALVHPICNAQQPAQAPAPSASSSDRAEQMRADLNQMESLMNNMQGEINFVRDQNLQILLNTNVRMWTILIRDLRRQLDEEQRRPSAPVQTPSPHHNDLGSQ